MEVADGPRRWKEASKAKANKMRQSNFKYIYKLPFRVTSAG